MLIDDSVSDAEGGSCLVEAAGNTMNDVVTQQNAATTEQSHAAAISKGDLAQGLVDAVKVFSA